MLDANYLTVMHGGDPAGCKGCIIIFSTGIPEYVIQCKVLSQWITIYTLHQLRNQPCSVSGIRSLCSGRFGQSRCTNTAPLGHPKSLTPISDPTQLSPEWHCQKLFCRIWFNENSDAWVPGLPGWSKTSNQLRFEGITPWSWLHGGSYHRGWLSLMLPLLANPFVGTTFKLSFINYRGPIDCLSPCNLQTKEVKISLKFQRIDYAYGHWHQGRVYFESVVANLRAHGWG